TPNPALSPYLASRRGDGRARDAAGAPRRGTLAATATETSRLAAAVLRQLAHAGAPARLGGVKIGVDGDEADGFQRPWLEQGPASTDAARPSDSVSDDRTLAMVSSE